MISVIGIDLAKENFHICGVDKHGKRLLDMPVKRKVLCERLMQIAPCIVAMEACGSANYWGRKFRDMGHEVKLIPAQYVKPFALSQKNDRNDALAIIEAAIRPAVRTAKIKELWQQDIKALHAVRNQIVKSKTEVSNQLRGLLMEYGVIVPVGFANLMKRIPEIAANEGNELTPVMRQIALKRFHELLRLVEEKEAVEKELLLLCKDRPEFQRLKQVPGIGKLVASQLLAEAGSAHNFKNGRHLAAWLGLVPRPHSSGGISKLMGITKRGDNHLRAMLIHGARSVILAALTRDKQDGLSLWIRDLHEKKGWNRTAVAVANKMARRAWHVWQYEADYVEPLAA